MKPDKKNNTEKENNNQSFYPFIITGLFFLAALFGILRHEMWRDEYQAWLVAHDAHSFWQLHDNLRYEGNPVLWHFLLYIITSFTSNPFYMQVFHLLLATGFVFVFNKYSPFTHLQKILFTFGYYALFEYSLISRSYVLGVLLLFIVCALYQNRHRYYLLISVLLFLLANTTVYGMIIATALLGILVLDYFFYKQPESKGKVLALGSFITLAGVLLSYLQIIPEKDNTFPVQWPESSFEPIRFQYVFSKLITSYFPIPDVSMAHFWNTSIFQEETEFMNPFYPFLLLIISIWSFMRKPLILLLYTGVTVGLLMVFYLTFMTHNRYCGNLFMIFLACHWLGYYYPTLDYKNKLLKKAGAFSTRAGRYLLLLTLLTGVAGGLFAYTKDMGKDFSMSKKASDYIKKNQLDTLFIIGSTDFVISPLAATLRRPIYYPDRNGFGSFTRWDQQRKTNMNFGDVVKALDSLTAIHQRLLLVLSTQPKRIENGQPVYLENDYLGPRVNASLQKAFKGGIVDDEEYYIYIATRLEGKKKQPGINEKTTGTD